MTQLILYTSEDGQSQMQLRTDRGTLWLTQLEMAKLFSASTQNISLHLKNIYQDGESDPTATHIAYWRDNVGQIIAANGFPLLAGAGSVSHARMEQQIAHLFLDCDQRRKAQAMQAADEQDEAELKALERRIKHRKGPVS